MGGATYDGISRRIWPKWGGWPIIDRSLAVNSPCVGADWSNLTALHELFFMEPDGSFRTDRVRLVGNVLVWQQGPLTLRIEGTHTLSRALALARSLS